MNNKVKVVVNAPNKIKVVIASKKYGNLIFKHAQEYVIDNDLFEEFKHVFIPLEFIEEKEEQVNEEVLNEIIEETSDHYNIANNKLSENENKDTLIVEEEQTKKEKKEKKKRGRKKKKNVEDEE